MKQLTGDKVFKIWDQGKVLKVTPLLLRDAKILAEAYCQSVHGGQFDIFSGEVPKIEVVKGKEGK